MTPDDTALRNAFLRAFPAVSLVIFLAAVDQTIVATALPAIAAEMGGIERTSWILVAYLVAATCAAPIFGQLGDAFGRRRATFIALAIFAAGRALISSINRLRLGNFVHMSSPATNGAMRAQPHNAMSTIV